MGLLSDGQPAASLPVSVRTLQSAPTGVAATYVSGNEVDLTWQNNSPTASGFQVNGSLNGGAPTQVGSVDSGATGCAVWGSFSPGNVWQFTVYAVDANNNRGPASVSCSLTVPQASNLPATPTGLSATANSPYQVTLAWNAVTGATSYIVERQDPGETSWQDIATTTSSSYVDTLVQPGTRYSYQVVAVNNNGGSAPSNAPNGVPVQTAPANLQATVLSGNQVQLQWAASTLGSGFTVDYSLAVNGAPSTWQTVVTVGGNATSTVVWAQFVQGQTYYFEVGAGTPLVFAPVGYRRRSGPSVVPTNFTATPEAYDYGVSLAWSDPTGGQATYTIQRSSDGGATWTTLATLPPGTQGYLDDSVIWNPDYQYELVYQFDGATALRVLATVGTGVGPSGTQPPAPTNLQVTDSGSNTPTFSWSEPDLSLTSIAGTDSYSTMIQWANTSGYGGQAQVSGCTEHVHRRGAARSGIVAGERVFGRPKLPPVAVDQPVVYRALRYTGGL